MISTQSQLATELAPQPRTNTFSLLKAIAIVLTVLAPFVIYAATAKSMVSIWNSSETFAHGYIIIPISLWLVWKRRVPLAAMTPVPFWPAMLLLVGCGFGWLLAELGDVQVVRQYAFVAMIPLAVVAVLGWRIALSLAFPLLFLLLAVPFGEIFIDPLINHTADFTVAALQATGIPVLREGTNFSIPSGNWSVVEACSGLRYLIASITLGCLYAHLTYRSPLRQAMFIAVSIVVPVIANWFRAYMIVMIGHLSGMELATGIDHLIYGWVFFGLVMFLMFWIGSYWREDEAAPAAGAESQATVSVKPVSAGQVVAAAAVAMVCIGIWPLYKYYLNRIGSNPPAANLTGFQAKWHEAPAFSDWKPKFFPANAEMTRFLQHDEQKAGVTVLYYRNQPQGAGLISSSNQVAGRSDAVWLSTGSTTRSEIISNRTLTIRETRIRSAAGTMLVWDWYWIDGRFTRNDYLGKLLLAKEKLLLRGDDGASILAFALYNENPESARIVLRDFLVANLSPLEATLAANKKQ